MNDTFHPAHRDATDDVVLSVIASCFNGEDNVDPFVDRTLAAFDEMGIDAEVLLIDDGSRDATWDRIRRRCDLDRRVRGIRHASNRGTEAGWRSGHAVSNGELTCLIGADLRNRPEDIAKLYKVYLRELPDVVRAARYLKDGRKRIRVVSRVLNLLFNVAFGTKLRDNGSGFILSRRNVLDDILRHRYHYRCFQFLIGVAAHAKGYTTIEVDTDLDPHCAGRSSLGRMPIMVSLRIIRELLTYRIEVWTAAGEPRIVQRIRLTCSPKPDPAAM